MPGAIAFSQVHIKASRRIQHNLRTAVQQARLTKDDIETSHFAVVSAFPALVYRKQAYNIDIISPSHIGIRELYDEHNTINKLMLIELRPYFMASVFDKLVEAVMLNITHAYYSLTTQIRADSPDGSYTVLFDSSTVPSRSLKIFDKKQQRWSIVTEEQHKEAWSLIHNKMTELANTAQQILKQTDDILNEILLELELVTD